MTILDNTPEVTVFATNGVISERGGSTAFVVARSGFYSGDPALTVNLQIGGTATNGVDYTNALSSQVTIPKDRFCVTNTIYGVSDTLV